MTRNQKHVTFWGFIGVLAVWGTVLYAVNPQELISRIGVENGYLFAFVSVALSGLSTVTATAFYPIIITLAFGGLNPLLLGLIAGIAITVGDVLYFALGRAGRRIVPVELNSRLRRFVAWLSAAPAPLAFLGIFVYAGLTPFPNDLLVAIFAVGGYPFWKALTPVILGNITTGIVVGYIAQQGVAFIG